MKKLLSLIAVCFAFSMAFAPAAHAADAKEECAAKSAEKKLAGAAKASFEKKCVADSGGASASASCEKAAADKKLAGAAKASFEKKCIADAGGASASASCEKNASDKKLAGAAKSSYMKKCVADAAGDKPMADAKPATDKKADAKPMAAASSAKK